MPDWIAASIRYAVTMTGVALAALDLVPGSDWDQIAPALTALVFALYGVMRTSEMEDRAARTEEMLEEYRAVLHGQM